MAEFLARLLVAAALVFHAAWLTPANSADSLASIEQSDKQQPIASPRPASLAAIKSAGEPARGPQAAAGDAILAALPEIAGITGFRSTPCAPDLRAAPADRLANRARAPPLA